jgi:hypothetical protein
VVAEVSFGNGDLVELDVGNIRALARVRLFEGTRMHLALEQGQYCPWVADPLQIRHFGDSCGRGATARIIHTGGVTVTLELLGPARVRMDTLPLDDDES